ncbi:hypothetical protein HNP46_006319 [Pseudomonas nitritireducens]|uniref:Uncharacterized protein n=1 Tax=Pseudomonas nitroreducens TaxID=46680 RepID=A0A7W7KRK4_PSENT|nr:hypothetical protein [Pseudomonas nitritireducens]MBB4867406.1 hypothetical protein [Pseudomonas nitritireducens]
MKVSDAFILAKSLEQNPRTALTESELAVLTLCSHITNARQDSILLLQGDDPLVAVPYWFMHEEHELPPA